MYSSLRLTSKTVIAKEEQKKLKNILQSLLSSNDSLQFRAPVDFKGLNLIDYEDIVKHPMDLGTVRKKFNQSIYLYVEEVLDDIQLIWDNCKLYNHSNEFYFNIADKLERSFKKMVKNYLPSIAVVVPGRSAAFTKDDRKISQVSEQPIQKDEVNFNEKIKFSERLKTLAPMDLGAIVQEIMQKCPSAFKQTSQQNAELLIDNLDLATFKQINQRIDEIMGQCLDKVQKRKI